MGIPNATNYSLYYSIVTLHMYIMACNVLGLWIDYDLIDNQSIIVMGDQLLPFSQLISRSCDHYFVPSFGRNS